MDPFVGDGGNHAGPPPPDIANALRQPAGRGTGFGAGTGGGHEGVEAPLHQIATEFSTAAANYHGNEVEDPSARITKMRPSCDECRARKKGCVVIGDSTVCLMCRLNDLDCVFSDRVAHRPRKRSKEDVAEVHAGGMGSGITTASYKKQKTSEHDDCRYSTPVDDYVNLRGHSLLKKTLSLQFPRCSYFVGETGVFDPLLLDLGPYDRLDQAKLAGDVWLRKASPRVMFTLQNDPTRLEAIRECDEIERMLEPRGRSLIELYFRHVHPCFPILHRKVFLEKYSRTHREFSPALLAAVYYLAVEWWTYDSDLAALPAPSPILRKSLYDMGINAFFAGSGQPRLSHIQAGLLLVQCVPNSSRNLAITSVVVSMGERLGLGLNCSDWKLPKWERGLRKRIAWGVYIQDKWMSLLESIPSHVDESRGWNMGKVHAEDFSDEFDEDDMVANALGIPTLVSMSGGGPQQHVSGAKAASQASSSSPSASINSPNSKITSPAVNSPQLYTEMCALSQIVAEIYEQLFSQVALAHLQDTEQILDTAKPMQIKLRTWYSKLPAELRVSNQGPPVADSPALNSNGYLHLAYFAAEITLHRRIIKSLRPDSPPTLVEVCRQAAQARLMAALDFVRSLRPENIGGFWHFSAASNFALIGVFASLLYLTAETEQEAHGYKSQLAQYIWLLRLNRQCPHIAHALQVLLVAISRLPGLSVDVVDTSYLSQQLSFTS